MASCQEHFKYRPIAPYPLYMMAEGVVCDPGLVVVGGGVLFWEFQAVTFGRGHSARSEHSL